MKTISLRLDDELLSEVDRLVKPYRYSNRTELIRHALREFVEKLESKDKKSSLSSDEIIAELERRFQERFS